MVWLQCISLTRLILVDFPRFLRFIFVTVIWLLSRLTRNVEKKMFDYELEGREDPGGPFKLFTYVPTYQQVSLPSTFYKVSRDWPQANPFNSLFKSRTLAKGTKKVAKRQSAF